MAEEKSVLEWTPTQIRGNAEFKSTVIRQFTDSNDFMKRLKEHFSPSKNKTFSSLKNNNKLRGAMAAIAEEITGKDYGEVQKFYTLNIEVVMNDIQRSVMNWWSPPAVAPVPLPGRRAATGTTPASRGPSRCNSRRPILET